MKRNRLLIALLLAPALLCIGTTAFGDDTYPPPWRGQTRATMQHWQFTTNTPPFLPEVIVNPFTPPVPTADMQVPYTWQALYQGRAGVLVKAAGTATYMQCGMAPNEIPNAVPQGQTKDVYVQLTYYQNPPTRVEIFEGVAPFRHYIFQSPRPINRIIRAGGWYTDVYNFALPASLANETVEIWWDPNPGFAVDQVVIDTRSYGPPPIPTLSEWGAIILTILLLGSAILVFRRRRGSVVA